MGVVCSFWGMKFHILFDARTTAEFADFDVENRA